MACKAAIELHQLRYYSVGAFFFDPPTFFYNQGNIIVTINIHNRWLGCLALALLAAVILIPRGLASTTGEVVKVRTVWPVDRARPGDSIVLAVVADIKEGFHINADEGQIGTYGDFKPIATRLTVVDAPDAATFETPRYPKASPLKTQYVDGAILTFEGQIVIYLPLRLAEEVQPGSLEFKLGLQY